jgi:hypothetical protein
MTLENPIETSQRTLRNINSMAHFREILISFLCVCGYNKRNIFDRGNLVFADV